MQRQCKFTHRWENILRVVVISLIVVCGCHPNLVWGIAMQQYAIAVQIATTTPTPSTDTPTPTPTATATATPVAVSTPFMFHFDETTVGQANRWFNEYNCPMTTSGQGSAKALVGSADNWGRATSETLTMNIDTNNTIRLVVSEVNGSTGNKIYLHEVGLGTTLVASGIGVGTTDINIPDKTGWSGMRSFYLEIVIESDVPNTGTRFDEIWIYPSSNEGFTENFRIANTPPDGWFQEYNVTFSGNGTDSAKLVTNAGDNWGSATSNTQNLNVDTYGILTVTITSVDSGTGNKILVHENGQSDIEIARGVDVGTWNYNLKNITGWSGTKSFYLKLIVQSDTPGLGTRFDKIAIGAAKQYPSLEP